MHLTDAPPLGRWFISGIGVVPDEDGILVMLPDGRCVQFPSSNKMNQQLDTQEWPAIEFQGELLPQSLSAIHILIYQPLSERTLDWIWKLPHCKEVWKSGEADWCIASATEITDNLLDHRNEIVEEIRDRLGPHEFDGDATFNEWLTALDRIRILAESADTECHWIAGEPTERAEETRRMILAFLDQKLADNT